MTHVFIAELNYIMALKSPATDETFRQIKADVEAVGGKVNYEFKTAFKGVLVQLPSHEFNAFSSKSYVDFMERDKNGKYFEMNMFNMSLLLLY